MNIKQAINYINHNKLGYNSELIETIGIELYNQFITLGFINKGLISWKITKLGEHQAEFYRTPNEEEKKLGVLYHDLGI